MLHFLSEDLFTLTNSIDPEMRHFIWVFTVCKSTHVKVSHIQRVNEDFEDLYRAQVSG